MNGWQRLWVVACVGLGIYMFLYSYTHLPNEESLKRGHDFQVSVDQAELNFIDHPDKYSSTYGGIQFGKRTVQQVKTDIASEDVAYDMKLKALTETRVKMLGIAGLWWLGLSLLIYLAGYSLHWVYRGFRPKQA